MNTTTALTATCTCGKICANTRGLATHHRYCDEYKATLTADRDARYAATRAAAEAAIAASDTEEAETATHTPGDLVAMTDPTNCPHAWHQADRIGTVTATDGNTWTRVSYPDGSWCEGPAAAFAARTDWVLNGSTETAVVRLASINPAQLAVGLDWYGDYAADYDTDAVDALYRDAIEGALAEAVPGCYISGDAVLICLEPGEAVQGFYEGQVSELADIEPSGFAERCELIGD